MKKPEPRTPHDFNRLPTLCSVYVVVPDRSIYLPFLFELKNIPTRYGIFYKRRRVGFFLYEFTIIGPESNMWEIMNWVKEFQKGGRFVDGHEEFVIYDQPKPYRPEIEETQT